MAVNTQKSYIWTADKDVNMKEIFAVMSLKKRKKKKKNPIRPEFFFQAFFPLLLK